MDELEHFDTERTDIVQNRKIYQNIFKTTQNLL